MAADTEKLEIRREQNRIRQQRARAKLRDFINSFKTQCKTCGENHPGCLQFHHRDPSKKLFAIQNAVATKVQKEKILKEIEKCDVLCANCHSKLHWEERNGTPS